MKNVPYKSGIKEIYERGTESLVLIPENRDICGGRVFYMYLSRSSNAEELYKSYLDGAKIEFDGTAYFREKSLIEALFLLDRAVIKSKALRVLPGPFKGKLVVDGTAVYKVSMTASKSESLISKILEDQTE